HGHTLLLQFAGGALAILELLGIQLRQPARHLGGSGRNGGPVESTDVEIEGRLRHGDRAAAAQPAGDGDVQLPVGAHLPLAVEAGYLARAGEEDDVQTLLQGREPAQGVVGSGSSALEVAGDEGFEPVAVDVIRVNAVRVVEK